jgi:hypothetical protein
VGIVDRLQALDERFIPWAKPRAPGTPPEWTPEVGPLVSVKRLREVIAWWSAGLGLIVTAVELVNVGTLKVVIGTLVMAVFYGFFVSLWTRDMLEARLGLARPVSAGIPLAGPVTLIKRLWPWPAVIVVALVIVALVSGTTSGGIVLGGALWQYREARWLGRWQDYHDVEVLLPVQGWRKSRGFYLRPAPFSGPSLPESVRKPPQN